MTWVKTQSSCSSCSMRISQPRTCWSTRTGWIWTSHKQGTRKDNMKKARELLQMARDKAKKPAFTKPGLFWHVHHMGLMEFNSNVADRLEFIARGKPIIEREKRITLLNPVKPLPPGLKELWQKYIKARKRYESAGRNSKQMDWYQLNDAEQKVIRWIRRHKRIIQQCHKDQCGCDYDYFADRMRLPGNY